MCRLGIVAGLSDERTLSHARPCLRISQPPPNVKPPAPVLEIKPPVVASPSAADAASTSRQSAPPCTVAILESRLTVTWRKPERSKSNLPSPIDRPATL